MSIPSLRRWNARLLRPTLVLAVLLGLAALCAPLAPTIVQAATPESDVADANKSVQHAIAAAQAGDFGTARQEYKAFESQWYVIEDGVREKSRTAYRSIEYFMTRVDVALEAAPPDAQTLLTALRSLERENRLFVDGKPATDTTASPGGAPAAAGVPAAASVPAASEPATVATLLRQLDDARQAVARSDYATALPRIKAFHETWLDVEGDIKVRSADAYRQTENDMALAQTLVEKRSPEAQAVLDRMYTRLEPYQQATRYGIFDAVVILLREGLEALLVIVALLAFLNKSGNTTGGRWVWGGAGAGLAASLLVGVVIQVLFSSLITPSNRESIEGLTGLVAAVMLLYVGYCLHSQSNIGAWQEYIKSRTTTALASGRMFGLGLLAFLAVFREGAETVLFFLGMTNNITATDLAFGLGIGTALLVILGFVMIVLGVRIPMRPFFTVASILVFYLCFKFTGAGIHALQVAGIVPADAATYLPSIDSLGMYPTWETTAPQLLLLAGGLAVWLRGMLQDPKGKPGADSHHTGSSGAAVPTSV
jgi:high-affinity iron transporter